MTPNSSFITCRPPFCGIRARGGAEPFCYSSMVGKPARQHNPQVGDSVNLLGNAMQLFALDSVPIRRVAISSCSLLKGQLGRPVGRWLEGEPIRSPEPDRAVG